MLMMLITKGERHKLIDLLSRVTIDLEKQDEDGNTALNIAVQNGNYEIVLALMKAGANMNTQNNSGILIIL